MKILRFFGLFVVLICMNLGTAYAAGTSIAGFGTPDDQVCDNNGCWYCNEDDVCSFCPAATEENPTPECRTLCPAGEYGDGTAACQKCTDTDSNYPSSMQGFNQFAGSCFKLCNSSCNEYNNWASYFGSNAGNFTYERFYPNVAKQLEFKMFRGNNCDMGTNYCTYNISCAEGYVDACKPGHVAVTFRDTNSNLLNTYYTVNRAVWSTQNTQGGMQHFYSGVTYPIFVTPTAPAVTGKKFKGWYDAQTGGTQRIAPASDGAMYGNLTFDLANNYVGGTPRTLYAQYEDIITAIQLWPNGGTPTTTYTIYYKNGTYYCDAAATATPITSSQNIFTRCNFTKPNSGTSTFNGYYSATSGGTQYTDADGKLLSAAYNSIGFGGAAGARWYAQYESTCDTTILLEVEANGGSFTGTCPSEFYPTQSGGQWLSPTLNSGCIPTRPGYTFMGYVWTNGIMYYDANLNPVNTVWLLCDQDKVILEAYWEGNCNLITFNDNNVTGTNVNANNTQRKRSGATDWLDADPANANACGKPMTTNPTVATPTNPNAVFQGYWTTRDSGGHQVFGENGAATSYGNTQWTISTNTTLYARWVCNSGYTWNAVTHACEQNTFSVKYMCYVGDTGTVDNSVTATGYHVRPVTFANCRMDPSDFIKWWFSFNDDLYSPDDVITPWLYGNNENFVPSYKVTFNCDTEHWMAPSSGNPNGITARLGGDITTPAMNCVPRPEYDGWVNVDSQWNSAYDHNMTTPVPGATCNAGDFSVNGGATFNWQCPTPLTFTPDDELITKTITVSCGTGGTTGQISINYGDDVSALVGQWLATNCTGSCQNPSGPSHGYWKFCGVWENGAVPNVTPINGEPGCYRAQTPYDLDQIEWENVTSFNITTVAYCPKYVKYKCSDDATTSYTDSTYSYFEEPYTVLDHVTTLCTDFGYEFDNWKVEGENIYYDENETVAEWPYETEVTLVAQWGDANAYNIIYHYDSTASWDTGNHPDTYTVSDLPLTINGVMTRQNSVFIGWCDDQALTQNCGTPRVIPVGTTGTVHFWAKWECMSPYHLNPNDPSQCVACPDNTWWNPDAQTCDRCSAEFPFSRSPYTWSEKQCYRPCQDGVQCNANVGTMLSGFPSSCQIELFPSGITTQIEFKGNYEDGIQTCGGAVPNCPYGFTACGAGAAYKPMVAPVEFHGKIPETNLGTRYIFGSRAGSGSIDLARGDAWSQIAGSGQKTNVIHNNVGGVIVDYQYTHIFYPTDAAPDATVPGYTFNGYYYPRSSGTRYVESNYLLNAANALAVLQSQSGDSNTARHLYATLENGYTQIDYTITYNCGTATGGTTPASQTGIHYGDSVTPQANTCTKPGYNFQGWMVSNTTDIQQPGVAFTWQYEENKTFTAKWSDEPIDYTITYNCGTGNPPAPESQTGIHYGDSVTPRANTCTKPGYNFQGWMVSNTADIKQPGVTFTWQYEEDKVFTAKWSDDPNTYVITYTPGYTGSGQSNVTQNITFETQFQTQGRIFTRTGHIMTGWSEPFPLLSHNYQYSIEGNTTLDAQWQICPNGQTPNEDGTECEPCPEGEAGVGGICNPCPAGTQPNANQTECVPCPDGQYSVNGVCMPCPAGQIPNANGDGCEPCPDGQYPVNGVCVPCPAGTYGTNGTCEPCPDGSSSNPGATSIDQCFITECPAGQHIDHGVCYDDVMECTAPHASYATRTWNPSLAAYGSCIIQECIDGYHIASNACVLDEQFCAVPNGRGEREWTGTQWGECIVTQCDPGFENTGTACSECDNRRVNGEIAVSSYASGCEIATCMYHGQKYILENNECRAICEKPDDHTGSMRWDDTTKKCVRTCNPGYKMW